MRNNRPARTMYRVYVLVDGIKKELIDFHNIVERDKYIEKLELTYPEVMVDKIEYRGGIR